MVTVTELNRAPDGRFESLEANTLLGADVANASENQILVVQGDGTLSAETQAEGPNPYDQAQSFAESDVTLTNTNTAINNGSIKLFSEFIDDFEDGDVAVYAPWSGWNGDTFALSAQQSTVISGSFSGLLASDDQINSITADRGENITNNLEFTVNIESDTGGVNDNIRMEIETTGAETLIGGIEFDDGSNDINWFDGNWTTVKSSWDVGSDITVLLDWDFANDQVDVIIDGVNEGTYDFFNSVSGYGYLMIRNKTTDSGANRNLIFDDVRSVGSGATSGNALIEWDRGIPTDIFEWDVATFTRTLDNETVDVFVAYSGDGGSTWTRTNGGNPITRNYSLNEDSNITTSENVRIEAELSRADTANNPTLDSAYRSWLV